MLCGTDFLSSCAVLVDLSRSFLKPNGYQNVGGVAPVQTGDMVYRRNPTTSVDPKRKKGLLKTAPLILNN